MQIPLLREQITKEKSDA
jgi:hypothetical protein